MHTSVNSQVNTSIQDGVGVLTLTNESQRNAITDPMVEQFAAALTELEADPAVRAVVITGAGKAFCAGADLSHLIQASTGDEQAEQALRSVYAMFAKVYNSPLPTIAAVNGAAVGAGMNLALACDVRITGRSASFSTRFLNLALHPGGGHTWMLQGVVGPSAACAMLLFNQDVDGEGAKRIGLAWDCVEDDALVATAMELAQKAARVPADVLQTVKGTIREAATLDGYEDAVEYEIKRQLFSANQDEFKSRMAKLLNNSKK